MSYCICRVEKYNSGAVKGIEIHSRREKDGVSHTNSDIDWERTGENYNLCPAPPQQTFLSAIKKRIKGLHLKKAVRKDAVVLCQALVTSDQDFFNGLSARQQRAFFKDAYKFLAARYGAENIISADVHMDEKTPHMHFSWVPVTEDGRLSAKSLLTPQSLRELQDEIYNAVGSKYGLERGERGSEREHLSTQRLKIQTAQEKLHELQGEILTAEKVNKIEIKKPRFGSEQQVISMPYRDALNLKSTAAKVDKADKIVNSAENIRSDARSDAAVIIRNAENEAKEIINKAAEEIEQIRAEFMNEPKVVMQLELESLKIENEGLTGMVDALEGSVDRLKDALFNYHGYYLSQSLKDPIYNEREFQSLTGYPAEPVKAAKTEKEKVVKHKDKAR